MLQMKSIKCFTRSQEKPKHSASSVDHFHPLFAFHCEKGLELTEPLTQLKIEYNARKMIELQEQKQGVEKQIAFFTADLSMLSSTRERDWEN